RQPHLSSPLLARPARSQASRLPSDEPEKYKSGRRASQGRATDCCCRHRLNGGQRLLHLLREGGVNETLDYDRQHQSRKEFGHCPAGSAAASDSAGTSGTTDPPPGAAGRPAAAAAAPSAPKYWK